MPNNNTKQQRNEARRNEARRAQLRWIFATYGRQILPTGHGTPHRETPADYARRTAAEPNGTTQQFTITMDNEGNLHLSVPGTSVGSRRKLDTSFGIEAAIRNEIEWVAMQRRWAEIDAAQRQAQKRYECHRRIVEHAAAKNPTTLQYIEPGAKPAQRAAEILATKFGEREVAHMRERGELRIMRKSPPRPTIPPPSSENIPI